MKKSDLIKELKNSNIGAGFVETLKIRYRPLICPIVELISEVKDDDSVFDIGCGNGQFAYLLNKYKKLKLLKGIDITPNLIANAKLLFDGVNKNGDVIFEVYDGFVFPNDMRNYDVIFLIDVLHHINPELQINFLQKIYESMNVGSRLILKDINASSLFVLFNKIHDLVFSGEIGKEREKNWLQEKLSTIGFSVMKVETKQMFVYPHVTFICVK